MLRRSSPRWLIPLTVVALLLPACSDSADDGAATAAPTTTVLSSATSTVTTTVPATTTTVDQTTTTSASSDGVTVTKDIVFLEMDGHEYVVDVYVPTGEGLRPVAVNFHGMGPGLKNDSYVTVAA